MPMSDRVPRPVGFAGALSPFLTGRSGAGFPLLGTLDMASFPIALLCLLPALKRLVTFTALKLGHVSALIGAPLVL